MSDATNDTTPPVSARIRGLLATMPRSCHAGHYDRGVFDCDGMNPAPDGEYVRFDNLEFDLSAIAEAAAEVEADLLRLAGPVCEHDGKRAIDHLDQWLDFGGANYGLAPHYHTYNCFDEGRLICNRAHGVPHPDSPIIEAWLRARSAK